MDLDYKWVSVDDRLPERDYYCWVLVNKTTWRREWSRVISAKYVEGRFIDTDGDECTVSHWMLKSPVLRTPLCPYSPSNEPHVIKWVEQFTDNMNARWYEGVSIQELFEYMAQYVTTPIEGIYAGYVFRSNIRCDLE